MPSNMDVVLYFHPKSSINSTEKLNGILEIARKRNCHVQSLDWRPDRRRIAELREFWHPIGAIAESWNDEKDIDPEVFGDLPTVFISRDPAALPPKCLCVLHDQEATARLAAHELLMTGYANFAFIHPPGRRYWAEERCKGFVKALRTNGKPCGEFRCSAVGATARQRELMKFIMALPKPCAVLAANDKTAEETLAVARLRGISVPGELAVLGVDNFEQICDNTDPPLSSIEPNFRNGGSMAMMMLLAAVKEGKSYAGSSRAMFGPLRIARRASTRCLFVYDKCVSDALDLIRREACGSLTAAEVAKVFPCSRRFADERFRKATGHSILEEIHAVRLDRAKTLLSNPNQVLGSISDFCGFKTPNAFRKFFKKETGMTLSQWRTMSSHKERKL